MGKLSDKWNQIKKSSIVSQKVVDSIKPDFPLKHKIDVAGKQLENQILKLDKLENQLKSKNTMIFEKIVSAQKSNNNSHAKMYANELAEIRKIQNMVNTAKINMQQVELRLNTVSDLGDVVVTLSPCMSLMKGIMPTINNIMPSAASSMQDVSSLLEEMMGQTTMSNDLSMTQTASISSAATSILEDAQSIVDGQTRTVMPEPPSTMHQHTSAESILTENSAQTERKKILI